MSMFGQQQHKSSTAGVDLDKEAGKRRETQVTLRKKDKNELLREKRRNVNETAIEGERPTMEDAPTQASLATLANTLNTGNAQELLDATTTIRKYLSAEENPPIDEVIQAQCVPKLVDFLKQDDNQKLQFEACWALTNIASGTSEHTMVVIHAGAVIQFVRLLSSPSDDVREQSVWALGNIAGDSAKCRDFVLTKDALPPLLNIIHSDPKITTLRNATWCLSNLFRGKPIPDLARLQPALPTLAQLVNHADEEVVADALWAVSYASDGPNTRINAVMDLNIIPRLVEYLSEGTKHQILCPALRSVGNIVTGDDTQTQRMIDAGILPCLVQLISYPRKNIKKECCWAISNITAGLQTQIQAVVDVGLLPLLVQTLKSAEYDVKKEALWAICNLTSGGTPEQVFIAVKAGCLEPMVELLGYLDLKIIAVVLEGIENILASGQHIIDQHGGENEYVTELMNNGGAHKIDMLQHHEREHTASSNNDVRIHEKASKIMQTYFSSNTSEMAFTEPVPGAIDF